jgi:hypothetical protein
MAQSFRESLDEFLDQTVDPSGESLPTKIELIPEGTECKGTVTGIRPIAYQNADSGEWNAMAEIMYSIDSPEVKEETGLDDPRAVQILRLDVRRDWDGRGSPPLEFGRNKNVDLGKLLTAFGMNDGRKFKWSSFMHEDAYLRIGRPRREEDRYAPVSMVGREPDDVKTRSKKK